MYILRAHLLLCKSAQIETQCHLDNPTIHPNLLCNWPVKTPPDTKICIQDNAARWELSGRCFAQIRSSPTQSTSLFLHKKNRPFNNEKCINLMRHVMRILLRCVSILYSFLQSPGVPHNEVSRISNCITKTPYIDWEVCTFSCSGIIRISLRCNPASVGQLLFSNHLARSLLV